MIRGLLTESPSKDPALYEIFDAHSCIDTMATAVSLVAGPEVWITT